METWTICKSNALSKRLIKAPHRTRAGSGSRFVCRQRCFLNEMLLETLRGCAFRFFFSGWAATIPRGAVKERPTQGLTWKGSHAAHFKSRPKTSSQSNNAPLSDSWSNLDTYILKEFSLSVGTCQLMLTRENFKTFQFFKRRSLILINYCCIALSSAIHRIINQIFNFSLRLFFFKFRAFIWHTGLLFMS